MRKNIPHFILLVLLLAATPLLRGQDIPSSDRAAVINRAIASPAIRNCDQLTPGSTYVLPKEAKLFLVGSNINVQPNDGLNFTSAQWSPRGNYIAFVSPTDYIKTVTGSSLSADGPTLLGISQNELWLYRLKDESWHKVSSDGATPQFSNNEEHLYYLSGYKLMDFNLQRFKSYDTGLEAPNTSLGLMRSIPMKDGTLLAPKSTNSFFERLGAKTPVNPRVELNVTDHLFVSPNGSSLVAVYNSKDKPSVAVVHEASGRYTTLLKGCSYSAEELTWSPDSRSVAYPLYDLISGIQVVNLTTGRSRIILQNDRRLFLSGIQYSPDTKFFAFARDPERNGQSSIWIISVDGTAWQKVIDGIMPRWSPEGKSLLYATREANASLSWHIIGLTPNNNL